MKRLTYRQAIYALAGGLLLLAMGTYWILRLQKFRPQFEDAACEETYKKFYEREAIDIKVVFGYKDARPARFVADRYERMIYLQRLTQKCRPKEFACEFVRSSEDGDLITKVITGPDGKSRKLFVRVIQSSVGPDDAENRKDPFQAWRTRYANLAFLQGLEKADVVIYNGHSRAGGGPDFSPPKLAADGDVDFSWYQLHQPGIIPILETLEAAPSRMKLLGLYSCASSKHFLDRLQKSKPDLGVITSSKLIYFADALESSLETLSSLIAMRCEGSFRQPRASGAQVSGFFD